METFSKTERLCSKVLIDKLVEDGKAFKNYPFKIIWLEVEKNIAPLQILISVPKSNFKKAVDRNYLKRLIRECYRKNKSKLFFNFENKKIIFMLIYISKNKTEFVEMENKIISILENLSTEINSK